MDSINDHIKIAQFIMRSTADRLDKWESFNNTGQRYLLEAALRATTDMYQHIVTAKVLNQAENEQDNDNEKGNEQ